MQNELDKYLDCRLNCFSVMNFRHWLTEKKGWAASCANQFFGENGPNLQYFEEKQLKSLILTQILVFHQSSEVPKNFYFCLWPPVTNFG